MNKVLLRHHDIKDIHNYDVYVANGGYEGLKKAIKQYQPVEVREIVKKSNLRGRGGAGFPAGVKWGFIPQDNGYQFGRPKYVVVNCDESETGTFKDRELISFNPHQVIEGALICAYAIKAEACYIYFRGEFMHAAQVFEKAVQDAYAHNAIGKNIFGSDFSCEFLSHYGAGAYICGEETALLESLEGKLGQPRTRPPFPAQEGLYGKPTVVNNVETLANVPPILTNGADWYLEAGTQKSPGYKIVCLSGRVNKPGNYEVPMGTTCRQLIYGEEYGGGISGGKRFKALFPSGGSAPLITEEALDAPLTFEGLAEHDSMLGSASLIVMDDTVNMVWAASKLTHFFIHESCGKCTPCRVGTTQMRLLLDRLLAGEGQPGDLERLVELGTLVKQTSLCGLGQTAPNPVLSTLKHFRQEYEALLKNPTPSETDISVQAFG